MYGDREIQRGNLEINDSEDGEITVGNTKRDSPLSFRLPPDIKKKLYNIMDSLRLDNRSLALKHIITNYDLFNKEKMAKINRIRKDMVDWNIKKEDL